MTEDLNIVENSAPVIDIAERSGTSTDDTGLQVSLLYQNIRGFNQKWKQDSIHDLFKAEKLDAVVLSETKLVYSPLVVGVKVDQTCKKRNGGCAVMSTHSG